MLSVVSLSCIWEQTNCECAPLVPRTWSDFNIPLSTLSEYTINRNNFSSWTTNTDLVDYDFTSNEPPKAKAKGLLEAYRFAAENFDLKHWKDILVEHQQALNADKERKASKKSTPKGKRKSSELVGDDDEEDLEMPDAADGMEFDGEEAGVDTKSKSKKRKKAVDSDGEAGKVCDRATSCEEFRNRANV